MFGWSDGTNTRRGRAVVVTRGWEIRGAWHAGLAGWWCEWWSRGASATQDTLTIILDVLKFPDKLGWVVGG